MRRAKTQPAIGCDAEWQPLRSLRVATKDSDLLEFWDKLGNPATFTRLYDKFTKDARATMESYHKKHHADRGATYRVNEDIKDGESNDETPPQSSAPKPASATKPKMKAGTKIEPVTSHILSPSVVLCANFKDSNAPLIAFLHIHS